MWLMAISWRRNISNNNINSIINSIVNITWAYISVVPAYGPFPH